MKHIKKYDLPPNTSMIEYNGGIIIIAHPPSSFDKAMTKDEIDSMKIEYKKITINCEPKLADSLYAIQRDKKEEKK